MPTTAERQQKGDLHWDLPEDRVERIRLERGSETIELAKSGDAWKLVQPEAYPADSFAAARARVGARGPEESGRGTRFRRQGRRLRARRPRRESDVYVDRSEGTGPASSAGPSPLASTSREPTSPRHRSRERPASCSCRRAWRRRFASRPTSSRARTSSGLRRRTSPGSTSPADGGASRWRKRTGSGGSSSRSPTSRTAKSWNDSRATSPRFGSRSSCREARRRTSRRSGSHHPPFRVTMADAKGSKHVLDLGSTRSDGDSVYASREGQVFTVPNAIVEELSREAVSFRDRRLVRFERSDVTGVESRIGARKRSFVRNQAGWSIDGRPLIASAADDLLTAPRWTRQSVAFLDESQAGRLSRAPARPGRKITVRLAKGPAWKIALYPLRAASSFSPSCRGDPERSR